MLTFEEFEKLLWHIDEQIEDRTALELFNKSLEFTHDAHVHPKDPTATTTATVIADDDDDGSGGGGGGGESSSAVDTGENKREVGAAIDDVTGDDNDGEKDGEKDDDKDDDDDDDDDDDSISPTCFVDVMLMHGHRFLIHTQMWIVDEEWIGVQWDENRARISTILEN